MSRRTNPWLSVGFDAWMLGFEASSVIGLRTLKVALGGAEAAAETTLMWDEKVKASLELQAMTGGLGMLPHAAATRTLQHYRRKVRANQRRLTRA